MRIAACLIAGFVLASLAFAGRTEPARAAADAPALSCIKSNSCSASACHGGGQVGKLGSEHTIWAPEVLPTSGSRDPHSNAYRTLFNPDSVRIGRLLGSGPAHENALCLKCHAPAGITDRTARAEGVGCTACHGSSEKWIGVHYLPEWKAKANRSKSEYGFIPTKHLTARISNCASCHVGSADREVNHDLIAAGHPRLAFEYTRFHFQERYRKHWEERIPQPEFEVRAWAIGQAACVRAAVEVLRSRAAKAMANAAPWPEFAGYSCSSCHQSIGERAPKGESGHASWEVWYTASLDAAGKPVTAKLDFLKKLMAEANPKPAAVEAAASAALAELDLWLADLNAAEELGTPISINPRNAMKSLSAASRESDWDAFASRYLGYAAMYHAEGGAKSHPNAKQPLTEIRDSLGFPKGFNNPKGFDARKVRGLFQKLEVETSR